MSSFFNANNPAMRLLTNICNLIFLNFCFILSCIPIITIGASISALYKLTIAILAGDSPSVFKDYFHEFRVNFKKSTIIWIVALLLCAFFGTEVYLCNNILPTQYSWTQYPIIFFIFVILSILCYAFPLIGWFEEGMKDIIKNSALLAILNFPTTLLILVINTALAYITYEFTVISGSLFLFMGFSLLALFYSMFLKRIFEKNGAEINIKTDKD